MFYAFFIDSFYGEQTVFKLNCLFSSRKITHYFNNKGEAETLAGFILEIVGNFPRRKQTIQFENCLFTIETVDKKRIKQIKVTLDA